MMELLIVGLFALAVLLGCCVLMEWALDEALEGLDDE